MQNEKSSLVKVLVLGQNLDYFSVISETLLKAKQIQFQLDYTTQLNEVLEKLATEDIDIILLDMDLTDNYGLEALDVIYAEDPDVPILVFTSADDEEIGVKALQKGAQDYLIKGTMSAGSMTRYILYAIERVRFLKELRKEKDRAQKYLDVAAVIFLVINKERKISLINRKGCEILGASESEIIGKDWFEFFVPGKIRSEVENVFENLISGETEDLEYYENLIRTANGEERIIAWHNTVLRDGEGSVTGVLSSGEDITERIQAEIKLRMERTRLAQRIREKTSELSMANLELARANRLKDEFLASMSHELRTPLNAILGMTEVLQKEIHGALNEKQDRCLQRIEESGRHLLDLINDILDLAKIGAGKLELDIRDVYVKSVCQSSLNFVKQQANKKNIKVSLEIDDALKLISADERRLKEILVNLLSNAVKFTHEGGEIGLEVKGDPQQNMVHFAVWDTGIGIREEDKEVLFRPFIQLDGSLTREHSGTGLGLALVKKLTELHSGNVSLDSKLGEGSRFTVSIPWQEKTGIDNISEEEQEESASTMSEPVAKRMESDQISEIEKPLVLLVDDDENCISFVSDFLRFKGNDVIIARDGAEAVQLVKEKEPNLVLMDIHMPGMNGLEAIKSIRSDARVSDTPIVALTGLAMRGDRERFIQAGANDYISKPVSLDNLAKVIEVLLTERQGQGSNSNRAVS
jgi:PAS domain S-box-containing protein